MTVVVGRRSAQPHVTAVVVTWNRRALLAEALQAIQQQTNAPDRVLVVDNASDDGTSQMLSGDFPAVHTIIATHNVGGAGGFAIGVDHALREGTDLLWLLDDDTVPGDTALARLLDARERYPGQTPVVVASKAVWTDGREHPMNVPRVRPWASAAARAAAASVGCVPVRSSSFVSVLIDAERVRRRGLPVAGYFLWNDDFEFTTRIIRGGVGLYCPASLVCHKTATFGSTDADPKERFFYEVRNKLWLFGRSKCLSPPEKALYAGSTVRRWLKTFVGSHDRSTLARSFGRGVLAALRSAPPPTREVIGAATAQPSEDR